MLSIVAISIISFGVWVHHMFATGLPQLSLSFFSAASTIITIPSGIQIFAWLATMLLGRIVAEVPFLFVVGFIVDVRHRRRHRGDVRAGPPSTSRSPTPTSSSRTSTTSSFGGAVFPMLAGIYYWLPKFTGRMYSASGSAAGRSGWSSSG